MRLKTTAWLLTVLLLIAAGCTAHSAGDAQQPGQTGAAAPKTVHKVRFTEVIHSVFYAPQYVAQAKGYFADEGIDLDTSTAQGSDKGAAALLAGTADIALVGPETTVFIYGQDTPVKVKLFAQMTTGDGSFLLARKAEPTFQWTDLKGKTVIGWRTGSMPQLAFDSVLKQNGVTGVNYVTNLAAPAIGPAFQGGQGDYLQVFEPTASQLEQAGAGHVVASVGKAFGTLPYTGYIATDKYIADHPDIVQAYTNAILHATQYLLATDPDTVAKEIARYFDGTDPGLLAASIRRYKEQHAWKETPVMSPPDFERLQDLLVAGGVLDPAKRAPFSAIAINDFADKALLGQK